MIPKVIEYVCLHEAGHAVATYIKGGHVELIELIEHASEPGKYEGRTRAHRPPEARQFIACGGFAVEYLLFEWKQLTNSEGAPLAQKEFIDTAVGNASLGKEAFFGGNFIAKDGYWPDHYDNDFMEFAIQKVAPRLRRRFKEVEAIADALKTKKLLVRADIEALLSPYAVPETDGNLIIEDHHSAVAAASHGSSSRSSISCRVASWCLRAWRKWRR
jgi:hypothetical protein